MAGITVAQIEEHIKKGKDEFRKTYKEIVEIPSVSMESKHKNDVKKVAQYAAELLTKAGAEAQVIPTDGNPGVFGHFENSPGAPTVAIYNHLDVQPAEKGVAGWTREPFKFTEENGRFYARGTTDDKGPAMSVLWAAKIARELKIPINIEFIWETSEEIGCTNFDQLLEKAKSKIRAKSVVVSDTMWISPDKPAIDIGLRGIVAVRVLLRTGKKELHSGVYGGAVRNPVAELCDLMSKCVNARTGEITIPGIEKTWNPPAKKELQQYLDAGFSVQQFKSDGEIQKLRTEDPAEVVARVWAMPTFEVHSIKGGYQGEGVKTIVAPEAEAKVSFRLVTPQKPDEILELFKKYVNKLNPDCEVVCDGKMAPYLAPPELEERKAASQAFEFATGKTPAVIRSGGAIGAVAIMEETLKCPVVFMGLSHPADGYHGPDESFGWTQIETGVKAFVKYFEILASKK